MNIYPWQNAQWEQVSAQATNNMLPHAYLFNGVKGIGKVDFASHFAAWLLCDNKLSNQSCGACKQCGLVQSDTHVDLKAIHPEEGSQVIKVDAIRALSEFISKSSNQGGLKIAVISPAESLNVNASNALLKTLEEPAPNSLIILVSHVVGQLLPTIRSRCQVIDFAKPTLEEASAWLNLNESPENVDELLSLASGAPLEVQNLNEMNAVEEHQKMLAELGAVIKRDVPPSSVAERWSDENASVRLSWMISWLENIIRSEVSGEEFDGPGKKMFDYLASKASIEKLFALYDECLQQARLVSGSSNPNMNLLFEHLFKGWLDLLRKPQTNLG